MKSPPPNVITFLSVLRKSWLILLVLVLPLLQSRADSGIGCPHSAARDLQTLYKASLGSSSTYTAVEKIDPDWAYIRIKVQDVPGLKADGKTLDFQHLVPTPMVVYPSKRQKSFWMHRDGETVHTYDALSSEGVDNLENIEAALSSKKFVVAEYSGELNWKEAIWTNTIVVHETDIPKSKDFARFGEINNRFLADFDINSFRASTKKNTLFMTVAKNRHGETLMTFFDPSLTRSTNHLTGLLHTFENDPAKHKEVIAAQFATVGKGGDVILYGDELEAIDLNREATAAGVNILRRSSVIRKNLVETSARVADLGSRKLSPDQTVFMNAVPKDTADLEKMGFPVSGQQEWQTFHRDVEQAMNVRFGKRIESKNAFFQELSNGNKDIVLIVAHNDGTTFYLNGEKITVNEISALPNRRPPSDKPRLAILVSCAGGKLSNDNANRFVAMFRRAEKGLGELLVEKGFVDEVIAPAHEIDATESVMFLKSLQEKTIIRDLVSGDFPGWLKLAIFDCSMRKRSV